MEFAMSDCSDDAGLGRFFRTLVTNSLDLGIGGNAPIRRREMLGNRNAVNRWRLSLALCSALIFILGWVTCPRFVDDGSHIKNGQNLVVCVPIRTDCSLDPELRSEVLDPKPKYGIELIKSWRQESMTMIGQRYDFYRFLFRATQSGDYDILFQKRGPVDSDHPGNSFASISPKEVFAHVRLMVNSWF